MDRSGLISASAPAILVAALGFVAGKRHSFDANQDRGFSQLAPTYPALISANRTVNDGAHLVASAESRDAGVPPPSVEGSLATRLLPFVLSVIAGSVDVIGFLGLGGLFVAHITGNLVILAAKLVAGDQAPVAHLLSVPVFMLVLLLTSLVGGAIERAGGSSLVPLLVLQLLALATALVLSIAASPWSGPDALPAIAVAMFGVAAMAVQNALVQVALRNTPSTAVMTTNLTRLMKDVGAVMVAGDPTETAKAKSRVLHALPVIAGFVVGCGLGAAAEAAAGLWSLGLPTPLALFAVAVAMGSPPMAGRAPR